MKKIIAILILLMACAPKITHIPRSSSFWGIDFSKYSNQNFLFTPYQYLGDYKSIGLITIKVWPEANLNEIIVEDSRGNKEKKEI